MASPVRSASFSQIKVDVLSVYALQDGTAVAQVQDGRGRMYPPIALYNTYGGGVLPQVGETWMLCKEEGAWTFKFRILPVTPVVDPHSLATVTSALAQLGLASITTNSVGPSVSPRGKAYASTAASLALTPASVPLQVIQQQKGGMAINTSTGAFTVPRSGAYQVNGALMVTTAAAAVWVQALIYQNGSLVSPGSKSTSYTSNTDSGSSVSDEVECVAGDQIALWGRTSTSVITDVITFGGLANYMSLIWLSY